MIKHLKKYLTIEQQMIFLKEKKKIEFGDVDGKRLLVKYGYFNLINGYKEPFITNVVNGEHVYIGKVSIDQFEALRNFDCELRNITLKYITEVEEELRTIVGYLFDRNNNNGNQTWYEVSAYDSKVDTQEVIKVIAHGFNDIERSGKTYTSDLFVDLSKNNDGSVMAYYLDYNF